MVEIYLKSWILSEMAATVMFFIEPKSLRNRSQLTMSEQHACTLVT